MAAPALQYGAAIFFIAGKYKMAWIELNSISELSEQLCIVDPI
jgi:hypothetical protein